MLHSELRARHRVPRGVPRLRRLQAGRSHGQARGTAVVQPAQAHRPLRHGHHAASAHGHEHAGVRLREAGAVQPSLLQGPAQGRPHRGPRRACGQPRAGRPGRSRVHARHARAAGERAGAERRLLLLPHVVPSHVFAHQPVPHVLQPAAHPAAGRLVHLRVLPAAEVSAAVLQSAALRDAGVPHRGAPRAVRAAFQSYRHLWTRRPATCSTCCSPLAGSRAAPCRTRFA